MNFEDWKHTKEYQRLIEVFGDFGYVEAIAEMAYKAGQDSVTQELNEALN